ncbi:hypothetical protein [Actinokineospora xionganensis]|uniref:Uncharacterized protein n=1 Tax=Actinokineospora xionganensis TaxID=2684470 RepID=A0ABR7LFE1_9PSEU|nr:hypothetical protein [Actinokineospora xionganensis]MBC6451308.1 hypothetical protein [Actinokineospora xionganensis]
MSDVTAASVPRPITYCERWNSVLRKPITVLSDEQANARHQSGELYTAVIGDLGKPELLIEVRLERDYVGVWFFDEDSTLRVLKYTFKRTSPDTMFMTKVGTWSYAEDARQDLRGAHTIESVHYQSDGTVRQESTDVVAAETTVSEYSGVSVDINAEPVPVFGQWDSLARRDRAGA